MKPIIFVSSTYLDLKAYRTKVWDFLNRYDIEVRGMEEFGSQTTPVLETCLKELRDCNIYIGIIGFRYGTINSGKGKSLTQIEYEQAIKQGIDIKVYLAEETIPFPVNVLDHRNYDKVMEFRKLISNHHTPDYFSSPDELARKIQSDIVKQYHLEPKTIHRPAVLSTLVKRFELEKSGWLCFIGILRNSPIEIFCVETEETFIVPRSIVEGRILKINTPEGERYDFQYTDKFGNPCTMGGLGYKFHDDIFRSCLIITSLMKNHIPLKTVLSIIDDLYFEDYILGKEWKRLVKEIIEEVTSSLSL